MDQSSMSPFDPNLFLDAQTDTANTRRPPLPVQNPESADGFYTAVIGECKTATGTYEKGERVGQHWLSILVPLQIQVPPQVKDSLGIDQPTVTLTDRVFIDLTPQNTIDNGVGRNRRQRQYREALDLNKPGDVWSWRMAVGQPIKVQVQHELYEGEVQERIGNLLKA